LIAAVRALDANASEVTAMKITKNVLESYLYCRYKGHLKLGEQQGTPSDYELLLAASREDVRRRAINSILAHHLGERVEQNVALTLATLERGAAYLLHATLEDDTAFLTFDALKRVAGHSQLGDFHYIPVLFSAERQIPRGQRVLLDVYGLLLARCQGRTPDSGIIWHGRECRATRVRLNPDPRKAERLLEELREMQGLGARPPLVLNDHCQVCDFRQR
jgi:predicted RecB family nuclease